MKRIVVLSVLLIAGALSITVAPCNSRPPDPTRRNREAEGQPLRPESLAGGGGGNSSVFITATGVVLVDTKNPGWGQPLLDAIKKITDKPVTTIINTHTHGDHVSGNVEFADNVQIIAHENTAANMKQMRPNSAAAPNPNPPNIFRDHNGKGLPKRTFSDTLTLGRGAEQIDLLYFGRAHTNGDTRPLSGAARAARRRRVPRQRAADHGLEQRRYRRRLRRHADEDLRVRREERRRAGQRALRHDDDQRRSERLHPVRARIRQGRPERQGRRAYRSTKSPPHGSRRPATRHRRRVSAQTRNSSSTKRGSSAMKRLIGLLTAVVGVVFSVQPSQTQNIPQGFAASNFQVVGYSEIDGRPGFKMAIREVGGRWYMYMGHLWHRGWTIMDVTDPAKPQVAQVRPRAGEHLVDPDGSPRQHHDHRPRAGIAPVGRRSVEAARRRVPDLGHQGPGEPDRSSVSGRPAAAAPIATAIPAAATCSRPLRCPATRTSSS